MSDDQARPRVLVVGQGPPTTGGIPSFITGLMEDEWLRSKAVLELLNTTPAGAKRPTRLTLGNLRQLASDSLAIYVRARRSDIVHLNLSPAPALPLLRAVILALAAKAGLAKVIVHAHSGRLQTCARQPAYMRLLRLLLRIADRLVVVSDGAQKAAQHAPGKVVRIDNGIDVGSIPVGPKAIDRPLLSFVGTVCERKGLLDLKDALVLLRRRAADGAIPLRVEVIGDGTQEGPGVFERIKQCYAESGLREVRFLGSLDRPQVLEILASSNMFCLPSHWEAFPLSLLEAMAAGAAPVATPVGDVAAILDHGRVGMIVPPRDPQALATAIETLLSDPQRCAALGEAARARVEQEYTLERCHREVFDLYGCLTTATAAPTRSRY